MDGNGGCWDYLFLFFNSLWTIPIHSLRFSTSKIKNMGKLTPSLPGKNGKDLALMNGRFALCFPDD